MKLIADENIPYAKEAFASLGSVGTFNGRELSAIDLKQTDILLVRSITQVNKALLENTSVKFVASATAGFNHIDLEYLKNHNIGFARAPGSNAVSAAEYVLAGICKWSLSQQQSLADLQSLKVGIIGYGNVGSRVKRLCESMGISCLINDPPLQIAPQQRSADNHTNNDAKNPADIEFSTLDEVLACDIITLHTPLSVDGDYPTYRLINQQRIKQLKPDTLFINASRGEVVEEPALLARMNEKNNLTLILDVWENEPKINLEMLKHTLIGTPHIAGYSLDGKIRGTEMIYQAVCEFLGVQSKWSSKQLNLEQCQIFDFKQRINNDIRKTILKSYDIMADDAQLKKVLEDPTLINGKYFDSLRKNYPIRREFSNLDE